MINKELFLKELIKGLMKKTTEEIQRMYIRDKEISKNKLLLRTKQDGTKIYIIKDINGDIIYEDFARNKEDEKLAKVYYIIIESMNPEIENPILDKMQSMW